MDKKDEILLGIDLGTSAVKILAVNKDGKVISSSEEFYSMIRKKINWVEQDPKEWWKAVIKAINSLTIETKNVIGIGLSGQLNGVVMVDKKGEPLSEAIIWLDRRSEKQAKMLTDVYGELIWEYSYAIPASLYNLSKLLWIMENEPNILRHTYKILFPKDFITNKLTGKFVTDISDAGATLMLNLKSRNWATEILKNLFPKDFLLLGKLPELHESTDIIGKTTQRVSEILGIPSGIPVVAGAGDLAALTLGTGVIKKNSACATIGTSGHITAFLPSIPQVVSKRLRIMCHPIPGKYFGYGFVTTAGYCLSWYLNNFGQIEKQSAKLYEESPYDLLLKKAGLVSAGSKGLIFLPYLNGVATPYQDSEARGTFIGITSNHRKEDFTRAVLEGVAYNFRDSFEILGELSEIKISQIRISEGGSRNLLWPKIISDVLGKNLIVLSELNSSALAAVILAGVGTGIWPNFQGAVEKVIKIREKVIFSQENHVIYNKYYEVYKEIYKNLVDIFSELSNLEKGEIR